MCVSWAIQVASSRQPAFFIAGGGISFATSRRTTVQYLRLAAEPFFCESVAIREELPKSGSILPGTLKSPFPTKQVTSSIGVQHAQH
jgi:hypothetical protein